MRDFSRGEGWELDFRLLRPGAPGEQLEAMVRELGQMLGLQTEWSGRGADEGRDLIFVEQLIGKLSVERVRWLVQCKDNALGGRSVREKDVGAIMDRVHQHRADGYLLVTTTTPSTGLKKLLDSLDLRNGGPTRTWVWDAVDLRRLLRTHDAAPIVASYFPSESRDTARLRHGMLTSLAALESNVSLLLRLLDNPSVPDGSQIQRKSLENMAAIVDDIRFQVEGPHLTSLERTAETMVLDRTFFDRIIRRARHFAIVHSSPSIEFHIKPIPAPPHRRVRASALILERAILEIISNAIRYRKPKECPRICISCLDEPAQSSIIIEDNGIGISLTESELIFQPGYRGPAAQRLSIRGSGLGLYTARKLVEQFEGDILFEGAGEVTRFRILLKSAKETV